MGVYKFASMLVDDITGVLSGCRHRKDRELMAKC